jgi:hypothetical protein
MSSSDKEGIFYMAKESTLNGNYEGAAMDENL